MRCLRESISIEASANSISGSYSFGYRNNVRHIHPFCGMTRQLILWLMFRKECCYSG